MKRLRVKPGSTATPSSPRSESEQSRDVKSSTVVCVDPLNTTSLPGWVVISVRPSGVNASAVGAPTDVTSSSLKPGGSVTASATGTPPTSTPPTTKATTTSDRTAEPTGPPDRADSGFDYHMYPRG